MDLLKSITHPDEVMALLKFKLRGCETVHPKCDFNQMSDNMKTCYNFLNMTSRSFAAVILALDEELRNAVCIFYLVLRALDTVEDDMTIPIKTKIPMLKSFYKNLQDPQWQFTDSKEKDKKVLEDFPVISAEFRALKPMYQEVIANICRKMGAGMILYLDKAPDTMEEWDQYCHYVAGLVGIGLSQLFSASGLEDPSVGKNETLSNSMGLFLQKTNIIRDYLEDVLQDRDFWPKEAWGKYGRHPLLLSRPEKRENAIWCLNELITNALQHVPDVIKYLSSIQNKSVFCFCAIPQVMAVATLERCYNNPNVFTGVVKIRKGETVRMMMEATTVDSVKAIIQHFVNKIYERVPEKDPHAHRTKQVALQALEVCQTEKMFQTNSRFFPVYVSFAMLSSAILWQYWIGLSSFFNGLYE